ncbi:MAG: hypothetical protein PNH44_00935 [Candidatus Carsonella ruddii]|nr:MAG: hypothetical protein PNH44_00935 [Candidatus Carsonella ruddii]
MKIILKKTNKNYLVFFINNNKVIYFIKKKKKNFLDLFEKIKNIYFFFKKKIFFNKKNYKGKFKIILDFLKQ